MSAPRFLLSVAALSLMGLSLSSFWFSAQITLSARALPSECGSFTDDPLGTSTPVKSVHISELRACVNALRSQAGLSAATWTDGTLVAGTTPVKAAHLMELRSALGEVYSTYGFSAPGYPDSTIVGGETSIKRAHISELRTVAIALDLPAAATPSFSPSPGTYNVSQNLTLSSTTPGASIRYTNDGSEPTTASLLYTSPIALSAVTTIKAKAFASGNLPSSIGTGVFTLQPATPTFSPSAGTYQGYIPVELSSTTPSAEFRYTVDGSEPTPTSALYESSINLSSTTPTTVKVKAYRIGWSPSSTASGTYSCAAFCQCPLIDPNDDKPDDEGLQCRLNLGGVLELEPGSPGYIVNGRPHANSLRGAHGQGLVLSDGTTHLRSSNATLSARIVAGRDLFGHILATPDNVSVSGFTIERITFDGMVDEFVGGDHYRKKADSCNDDAGNPVSLNPGNLVLAGSFIFQNNESMHALCGSGLGLAGTFTVQGNYMAYNGRDRYSSGSGPRWSDGLSAQECTSSYIGHNVLVDNTDIALAIGGGHNCHVEFNEIAQLGKYAFAGLSIGNFFYGVHQGDHEGSIFNDNTVYSVGEPILGRLSLGILIGSHPWSDTTWVFNSGTVAGNTVHDAGINLVIEGVCPNGSVLENGNCDPNYSGPANGVVGSNTLSAPRAMEMYGQCAESGRNFTIHLAHAPHVQINSQTPSPDFMSYDLQACGIIQ